MPSVMEHIGGTQKTSQWVDTQINPSLWVAADSWPGEQRDLDSRPGLPGSHRGKVASHLSSVSSTEKRGSVILSASDTDTSTYTWDSVPMALPLGLLALSLAFSPFRYIE